MSRAAAAVNSGRNADLSSNSFILILRSRVILLSSLIAELSRGLACCKIAKTTSDDSRRLQYLLVAEATSAKFYKLRSQGKIVESKAIQRYMARLEEELGGRLYIPRR